MINDKILRPGFRWNRQAEKIPDNKQGDADEFRQRGRDVNKRAAEDAAERGADEAERIVNAACGAAASRGYSLAEKRGKYRLVQAVTEEERAAADVKKQVVMGAEQIKRITQCDGEPAN